MEAISKHIYCLQSCFTACVLIMHRKNIKPYPAGKAMRENKCYGREKLFQKIIKHEAIREGYGQTVIFLRGGLGNFQKRKQFLNSKKRLKGRARGAMGKNRASRSCVRL